MATATPQSNVLEAQPRTPGNKNDARRVRVAGMVPAILYGAERAGVGQYGPRHVTRFFNRRLVTTRYSSCRWSGERTRAMIVDWQYEPIRGSLLHIDLKRIAMDQRLTVAVPIMLKGEPTGVKHEGGIMEQVRAKWRSSACRRTFLPQLKLMSANWCWAKWSVLLILPRATKSSSSPTKTSRLSTSPR